MFDSLDEQIKHDEHKGTTSQQRVMHWVVIGVIAAVAIGGLCLGVSWMR
jgi:hypothetical protein